MMKPMQLLRLEIPLQHLSFWPKSLFPISNPHFPVHYSRSSAMPFAKKTAIKYASAPTVCVYPLASEDVTARGINRFLFPLVTAPM